MQEMALRIDISLIYISSCPLMPHCICMCRLVCNWLLSFLWYLKASLSVNLLRLYETPGHFGSRSTSSGLKLPARAGSCVERSVLRYQSILHSSCTIILAPILASGSDDWIICRENSGSWVYIYRYPQSGGEIRGKTKRSWDIVTFCC